MRSRLGRIAGCGFKTWLFVPAAACFIAAGWLGLNGVGSVACALTLLGVGLAVAGRSQL